MAGDRWTGARIERWLRGLRGRPPLAVVLGASVNGLSFVRSLARRGVPTLLLDSDPLIGRHTRHGRVQLLPSAEEYPEQWMELLEHVGSGVDDPPVLVTTSDVHGVLVAEHAEPLSRYFRFLIPSAATMERIVDKRSQYAIAEAAGIPIPKSHFPESLQGAADVAGQMSYPCILKPYKSHVARRKTAKKVAVVHSSEELIREYERIANAEVRYMIQEIIPGEDDALFGYLAFWDATGREHAWLTKRKLRQNPPHYGDGSLQITVEAPEVAALSRRLLKAFDYRGFVGVEFKYDARDQTYRLMEINPRTVSGNQLAISAGVDFPWIGYRYLTAADAAQVQSDRFRPGVKYVNEEWDFKAYLALRKSGQLTLWSWLRSLRGVEARAVLAWDDPLPLAAVIWRFLRAGIRQRLGSGDPHS